SAAIGDGVGQGQVTSLTGTVGMNGDQVGDTAAFHIGGAHRVTGCLGGDHDDVQIVAGLDLTVMDVETVGKAQCGAGADMGSDFLLVDAGNVLVRQQHHHDVGLLHGRRDVCHSQTGNGSLLTRGTVGAQTH